MLTVAFPVFCFIRGWAAGVATVIGAVMLACLKGPRK